MTKPRLLRPRNPLLGRRNFLRGAAGLGLALPFLEGLPDRSAWAQDNPPIFSFFLCAVDGCVPESFFPSSVGALSQANLEEASVATSGLARHAEHLLFLSGIDWPQPNNGDSHIQGLIQALTARSAEGTDANMASTGPSADAFIASRVHPDLDAINLYAGMPGSYGGHCLSWKAAGERSPATTNPYTLYAELIGLTGSGGGMTPEEREAAELLVASRNSIHDLLRDELQDLMANSRLSADDRQRLQQHFDAIRDAEVTMGEMGDEGLEMCTAEGLDVTALEALENYTYDARATEQIVELHMSLVALAFACNYRRTATLQWGDPYDRTIYDVPSNDREWIFAHIDHRIQSDGATGNDALAAQAHAEIDAVRMQTLARGLDHFAERGLVDRCFVLWTLNYLNGAIHSFRSVPHIVWGNAGGVLKQGEYLQVGGSEGVTNNQLHNALISAAIQDTGEMVEDFGEGTPGLLEDVLA